MNRYWLQLTLGSLSLFLVSCKSMPPCPPKAPGAGAPRINNPSANRLNNLDPNDTLARLVDPLSTIDPRELEVGANPLLDPSQLDQGLIHGGSDLLGARGRFSAPGRPPADFQPVSESTGRRPLFETMARQ